MKIALPLRLACVAILSLSGAIGVQAQATKHNSVDQQIMTSDAFLSAHPDLRNRLNGLLTYKAGKYEDSMKYFRRAARYGDKPSQAMVAEMLWEGTGAPANRPLAYAWMDLAAERQFKVMLIKRERYWKAMTEAERAQALTAGEQVYQEYSDAVAKPRLEKVMRLARKNVVGSRTGYVGSVMITIPGPGGDITLHGKEFYQDKFWKPESYWKWQAEDWKELPKARVDVGPLKVSTPR